MKVVINTCYGGFGVSLKAVQHMAAAGCEKALEVMKNYQDEVRAFEKYKKTRKLEKSYKEHRFYWDIYIKYKTGVKFHGHDFNDDRANPHLVAAVEALGDDAAGEYAELRVVEIPDGVDYEINEYDGREHIAERHRTWS